MDILSLISEQATSVSLAIVVMWFYNKLVIDFLSERKEMIEALRTERREWLTQSGIYFTSLLESNNRSSESLNSVKLELHNLRGDMTKFILEQGKGTSKRE